MSDVHAIWKVLNLFIRLCLTFSKTLVQSKCDVFLVTPLYCGLYACRIYFSKVRSFAKPNKSWALAIYFACSSLVMFWSYINMPSLPFSVKLSVLWRDSTPSSCFASLFIMYIYRWVVTEDEATCILILQYLEIACSTTCPSSAFSSWRASKHQKYVGPRSSIFWKPEHLRPIHWPMRSLKSQIRLWCSLSSSKITWKPWSSLIDAIGKRHKNNTLLLSA